MTRTLNILYLTAFSGSGVISKKELKLFYTAFLDAGKLDDTAVAELTDKSYCAMTSNGEVQLSFHMYKLSFLNFLLGKQPNGPGQWLFGQVEREGCGQEQFLIDFTLWSREGEMLKPVHSMVGVEQKDRKTEKEDDNVELDILPTKLICANNSIKADVEKTVAIIATESKDKEEGLKSRGENIEGNLQRDEREINQSNRGTHEVTANDNAKETRENYDENKRKTKAEPKDGDNRKKKTDQGRKKERMKEREKRLLEKESMKESAIENEEDKVRIKRVEVTSKKSILV